MTDACKSRAEWSPMPNDPSSTLEDPWPSEWGRAATERRRARSTGAGEENT
jgi:hypothetical protein